MHSEAVVIGAGVVGLACAASLVRAGRTVIVLERHRSEGHETSSRNSGVIHAGLYYPPDSHKARFCVRGRELLYDYCHGHGIPHRKTGKLVVATSNEESEQIEGLYRRGTAAGAGALEIWSGRTLIEHDPALRGVSALWSPESGVLDVHELLRALLQEVREGGGDVVFNSEVRELHRGAVGWNVEVLDARGDSVTLTADWVVSAAGLHSNDVLERAGLDIDALGWRQHYCKGRYFAVSGRVPLPRTALVYPVPAAAGLGVHLTVDMGGRNIAGPDTCYVDALEYDVEDALAADFARSIATYMPCVTAADLSPAYSGIRPKLQGPGQSFRDFVVEHADRHGAPGLIALAGIESPGLTSALAIGEHVASLL